MSAPAYYRGRPASFWTALTPRSATTAAAGQAATHPGSPRPAAAGARQRSPQEATAPLSAAAVASAWKAWGAKWFTPLRRHA